MILGIDIMSILSSKTFFFAGNFLRNVQNVSKKHIFPFRKFPFVDAQ